MNRNNSWTIAGSALVIIATTGCHATMAPSNSSGSSSALPEGHYTNVGAEWPLKFRAHYFSVSTYSTYDWQVEYGGRLRANDPENELQSSSESLGSRYPDNMTGRMGPIANFPPPAKVAWRSQDGAQHHAEIDIGEIFSDGLIRHRLRRDEISEQGAGPGALPGIILEVNDRTINVYMRAHISTKDLQEPGNRYSDFRNDLIKVFSRTY